MSYIIQAKRSAIGKYGKGLLSVPATDIASRVILSITSQFERLRYEADNVILGNVFSYGLGQNPARISSFRAGIPVRVPAFTINDVCGSGLKSVILGDQSIATGESHLVITGGMENMSRCPYILDNYRFGARFGDQQIRDPMIYDGLYCSLIKEHMGMTAEYLATKYKITRQEQDEYAYESHDKALKAIVNKKFADEIVPMEFLSDNVSVTMNVDEQPRQDNSLQKLSKLKAVFKNRGTVTAGNSCPLNDGASVIVLASERYIKRNKVKPLAIIRSQASIGLSPKDMGIGAFHAAIKCLKKVGLSAASVDLWEINEAFSSQCIANIRLLKIDGKRTNVNGGSIALGHPIGATGARILTTLIYELRRKKLRYGVASLCIGGGQGIAVLIESI